MDSTTPIPQAKTSRRALAADTAPPPITSIVDLISTQAANNPEAVAVTTGTASLTYGELDRQANQMANYLIDLGVSPEVIVAICLERSFDSVIAALAVLKAGGAYLPLEPNVPLERLNFVLGDARPQVLITRSKTHGAIGSCAVKIVDLDSLQTFRRYATHLPARSVSPDQLAYVIYTSGSTGQPKGVEITIANLLNLISWHQREFQITATDRASHLAAVGFDAGVWEMWPYLTAGATICLPDEATRLSAEMLRDWIIKNQITVSFLPTVLAEQLITLKWPHTTALRYMLTGAETLHHRPALNLPFELVNNYGPTECTVVATSGRVSGDERDGLPTIGRPIANTRIYILDAQLRQVAPGEIGEIFIAGANVGRGYLNDAELTKQKFIQDPFRGEPGARMYRTGDLARRTATGEIAYLGRADEQIKLNGYRIEPAEIETALNRHPAISSSVVVACRYDCAPARLVAYVTLKNGSSPTASEMRDFLQPSLPEYMIPALFVQLARLPLTPNGKLDRKSLPYPDDHNRLRDDAFIAPRTPTEIRVAEIIGALFKVQEVGVNDNFFLLGGHSLLGAQLITRVRQSFGIELPLRAIFDAPTIAALAATIEREIVARVAAMSEAEAQALVA